MLPGGKKIGVQLSPTVLDNVKMRVELVLKEPLGPIAPIIDAASIKDTIEIENSTN